MGDLIRALHDEGAPEMSRQVTDDMLQLLSDCNVKTVRSACARALGLAVQCRSYKVEEITQLLLKISCNDEIADVRAGAVAALGNTDPATMVRHSTTLLFSTLTSSGPALDMS